MNNNYSGQILVGIIVTVIGGVILAWLVGDGRFGETASVPQNSGESTADTNPPAAINTPAPTNTNAPDIPPTPWGIRNPSSPIPQGERALMGDYAIWVSGLTTQQDGIWFDVFVENIDASSHILRFTKISFTLEDDLGNKYPAWFEDDSRMHELRQLTVDAGEVAKINGTNMFFNDPQSLAHFVGPINGGASKLLVVIKGESPFNGLKMELDL